MVAYAFNSQQHQPKYGVSGGLPAGPNGENVKYKVVIASSEQKMTTNQQGGYIQLGLKCIEGPQAGNTQFDNLNLHNQNPKAVDIANQQLSAYCHVTGQFQIGDTLQLHDKPFIAEIGLQKAPNPEGYTEVKRLYDINGNEPGKAGAGPQVHAPAAQPPPQQPPAGGVAQQTPPAAPTQAWGAPPAQQEAPQPVAQPQQAPPGQWGAPPAQPAPAPAPAAAPAPAWGGQAPAWGQPPQG